MSYTTLISAEELAAIIDRCVVVDCRHDLMNPQAGIDGFRQAHLPKAVFLSQDTDLAGAKNGRNGRHPLPDRAALAARLRAIGLNRGQQLVVCDAQGGMYAGRLWWLARWLGHANVAVLDGGLAAWQRAGFPVASGDAAPVAKAGDFEPAASLVGSVDARQLQDDLTQRRYQVVDARAGERYRGEVEPMDRVAGHIPGALNRPFAQNLRPDGTFKPGPVLRAEFQALLGTRPVDTIVQQCGSGVTACHNILAMEHAGLGTSLLYPGSWSEWSSDESRPVATGATPG